MTIEAVVFDAYGTLYDVQSVFDVTEREFPGRGNLITQVWRMKQLEYTWLRSQMGAYRSFWEISEDSLAYTLDVLGLEHDKERFERIMEKYLHLDPYPDTVPALDGLKGMKRAILSNGNQQILDALVQNTGLNTRLEAVISIEEKQVFKPNPAAYDLIGEKLDVAPEKVLFVSSNAFDACGARHYGLNVAWIERVTAAALREELARGAEGPATMFRMLRMRMEHFDLDPNYRLASLGELPTLVGRTPLSA